MNKIVLKKQLSEKVFLFEIEAPLIAKSRKAGNFIIVRVGENGERVPLTIADASIERGTITIVVQKVGLSSTKLCNLNEGDYITANPASIRSIVVFPLPLGPSSPISFPFPIPKLMSSDA